MVLHILLNKTTCTTVPYSRTKKPAYSNIRIGKVRILFTTGSPMNVQRNPIIHMEDKANLHTVGIDIEHEIENRMDDIAKIHSCTDSVRTSLEVRIRRQSGQIVSSGRTRLWRIQTCKA